MGVVCILEFKVADGQSGQQTVEQLQQRIELLGGIKTGAFTVDCETFQAVQLANQKLVHVLHNSEQPATCFAVHDSGLCLVADSLFDILFMKLKDYYSSRKYPKIESKGQRYEVGDFVVKIGSVVFGHNTAFKGILVEVFFTYL